nr:hypothetical protein [Burkholderia pseudomallei]
MSAEPIVTLSVARTLSAAIGAAFRRSDRASARRDSRGRRACASARRASTRRRPAARCAPSAGLGRALARQAAPGASLSRSVASATVNKVRGSGMRAIRHAFDAPANGSADVAAAGGMARSACAAAIARDTRRSTITSRPTGSRTPAIAARRWANSANAARHGFTHAAQDAYAAGSLQWAQHAQLAIELT